MYANVNDFRENNFFPVFGCILENSLENILQCLEQRKIKKKKSKTHCKKIRNPLQIAIPPPQSTINPPQTTIKKPTNPPSQQNPLRSTARAMTATAPILRPLRLALIQAQVPPRRPQPRAHRPHQPSRQVRIWGGRERERVEKESREREQRESERVFRKMVYGKFFRKPFSKIFLRIFRSNYKQFL